MTAVGDGLPGYTCPTIDAVLSGLRKLRRLGALDPFAFEDYRIALEGLRTSNTQLRDGYTAAMERVEKLEKERDHWRDRVEGLLERGQSPKRRKRGAR